jgi:GntR family transcriptional repressor for pyruvate dehydrogenase complex
MQQTYDDLVFGSERKGRLVSFARMRLTEQVEAHMTRLITEAAWPPGTMLPPEGELAQQFGVSRTVIRECVHVLASRGMLAVKQGRGTIVTDLAAWNVAQPLALLVKTDRNALLNWLEVRTILEKECAALAAQRRTDDDGVALRRVLADAEQGFADPESFVVADSALHLAIAAATHNPALARLLEPVVQPLRERLQATALLPSAREHATQEHRRVVERILAGDSEGARAAMAEHLGRVVEEIADVLAERQES